MRHLRPFRAKGACGARRKSSKAMQHFACQRPPKHDQRKAQARAKLVEHTAANRVEGRVGEQKSSLKIRELLVGDRDSALDCGDGNRDGLAVKVADRDRRRNESDKNQRRWGMPLVESISPVWPSPSSWSLLPLHRGLRNGVTRFANREFGACPEFWAEGVLASRTPSIQAP